MPLVIDKSAVLKLYKQAYKKKWVLPCFCSENLTTTEAILTAVKEYGESIGVENLPVIIAITNQYEHRSQSTYYTHTRKWDIGLRLFMEDLKVLTSEGSPFAKLDVMVHLDHTQFDSDKELLSWDMNQFSSIMFDASAIPFSDNIALTRQFVEEHGSEIVIEGACDEIVDATGSKKSELTTAETAEQYVNSTGVDLIVANLGTEHRALNANLKYYGDLAKKIKEKIGCRIVLHGASSVSSEQIMNLFEDGVCKVNIWTTLERDTAPVLLREMVQNASKIAGAETSIDYFTTYYRQNIIFCEMKKIVRSYLELWYK